MTDPDQPHIISPIGIHSFHPAHLAHRAGSPRAGSPSTGSPSTGSPSLVSPSAIASVITVLNNSVVVFSKNYLPLARVNIRRAVVLLVNDQAEPLLDMGSTQFWEVRSPSHVVHVPEHIRLLAGNPERHWKVPPVNRREVLKRDNYTCQYCGSKKRLTLDHVIPRSKGGQHSWDNVVTACESCNGKKGDRLLHEVGMVLKGKPKAPIHPTVLFAEKFWEAQSG